MRLKLFLFTTLFCITNLFFFSPPVAAGCSNCDCGGSCGTVTCETGAEIQNNNTCGEAGARLNCTDSVADCNGQNYDADDPYGVWCPYGYPNTNCRWECVEPGTSCVVESATMYCGACDSGGSDPTPTPGGGGDTPATPTPTRMPTPTGTRTPTPTPTPGTVIISGSIHKDINAGISGYFCSQETAAPLTVDGIKLYATNIANIYTGTTSGNNFSINTVYAGNRYTILLDLSSQTGGKDYICICPAAIDPDNPYLCRYSDISSPNSNVNFYIKQRSLTNDSWFQVFGGNFFAQNLINSPIPFSFCSSDSSCQAALSAPVLNSSNKNSSGFALTASTDPSKVKTSANNDDYHSFLHLLGKGSNFNAYSLSSHAVIPSYYTYNHFYKLAQGSIQELGSSGTEARPVFSELKASAWWNTEEANYVRLKGNVTIDETQNFHLSSTDKLVVFVEGNLTFDDSNPSDSNYRITSVENGGFLAFFVSGDITVTADVGYELNPSAPTVVPVSIANSNLAGVYLAGGEITIASKTSSTVPDKKFIGSGTFVGLTGVNLDRSFDDGNLGAILNKNQAVENFIYRIDLLVNYPTKLKTAVSNWHEVAPRLVEQ